MSYVVEIVPYDPIWPTRFAQLGRELRAGLGTTALRIDHIGSTSIPGLAAKPIIDIQISVASFEPLDAYRLPVLRQNLIRMPNASHWSHKTPVNMLYPVFPSY